MTWDREIHVPAAWQQVQLSNLHGVLMIIGATDAGKTTFARYLYHRLIQESRRVAFLDGDPGQSELGPPTTLTLAVGGQDPVAFPPQGQRWRCFIGSVSPRGFMLPLLVAVSRLVQVARTANVDAIVYDTTGLVDPAHGGTALKLAKINLLQPGAVLAIQQRQELEPLLAPLRRSRRAWVIEVPPSPVRQTRSTPARQAHRAARFARYFARSRSLSVDWRRLAVFPTPQFTRRQLVAFEDRDGFALGLGLVQQVKPGTGQVQLFCPLESLDGVDALTLGSVTVDPATFEDQPLPRQPAGHGRAHD